jgi:hypothetical protein
MKREDIIQMAQEIAAQYSKAERFQTWTHDYLMQRLMELVTVSAAAEREACAKMCEDDAWRCKKIAVETQNKKANAAALEAHLCAEAIRARSNT